MPAKKTPAAPVDDFTGYPSLAIIERRLEHPDDPGSQPIYLKDDPRPSCDELSHFWQAKGRPTCSVCKMPFRKWKVRTINAAVPNRLHGITYNKGYVKVLKSELADVEQIADLTVTADETVRRGEGGRLVVVKMPFPYYAKIKRAEWERRQAQDKNAKVVKEGLADTIGAALGDEAGSTVHGANFVAEFDTPNSTIADELRK